MLKCNQRSQRSLPRVLRGGDDMTWRHSEQTIGLLSAHRGIWLHFDFVCGLSLHIDIGSYLQTSRPSSCTSALHVWCLRRSDNCVEGSLLYLSLRQFPAKSLCKMAAPCMFCYTDFDMIWFQVYAVIISVFDVIHFITSNFVKSKLSSCTCDSPHPHVPSLYSSIWLWTLHTLSCVVLVFFSSGPNTAVTWWVCSSLLSPTSFNQQRLSANESESRYYKRDDSKRNGCLLLNDFKHNMWEVFKIWDPSKPLARASCPVQQKWSFRLPISISLALNVWHKTKEFHEWMWGVVTHRPFLSRPVASTTFPSSAPLSSRESSRSSNHLSTTSKWTELFTWSLLNCLSIQYNSLTTQP